MSHEPSERFTLGIILARAGSKGLPNKCVRALRGRALIEYTFDHALAAGALGAVVLSTDSEPAARLAAARGIEVIRRPAELADDTATVDAAARHAVEHWERQHARAVDAIVLLYGNIPLRAAGAIDRAVGHLWASGASSVRTVAPVGRHHPDWLHRLDGDRLVQYRANSIYRRQDLEPLFYHDGAVVAVTRVALFDAARRPDDAHAFFGSDRRGLVGRCDDSVDVDEPLDLLLADAALAARAPGDAKPVPSPLGVEIGTRRVGAGHAAYVIAEAGVNHNGDVNVALRMIDCAAEAGADAVKFQIFTAAELTTRRAPLAAYQQGTEAQSQRELLRRLELSDGDFERLAKHCRERGIDFLATPFTPPDLKRLLALDVNAIKVASTDLNNLPLLKRMADSGRAILLSSGAATVEELDAAIASLRAWGAGARLVLLHCVSSYPTPPEAANLRAIRTLAERFGLPTGYSDHTQSPQTGAWAAALGACVIEKHFTLDASADGPDQRVSVEPAGLRAYVAAIRAAEQALGSGGLGFQAIERDVRRVSRKSIVAAEDLRAGDEITLERVAIKRPGYGIGPDELGRLLGKTLRSAVAADEPLTWEMVR